MTEPVKTTSPHGLGPHAQPVQLQVQPVDNGFLIVVQNVDGKNKMIRQVATDMDSLREQFKAIADLLFVVEEKPEEKPGGTAGTQSTAGTQESPAN
jgi:hypothetical protein